MANEQWDSYFRQIEGKPASIRVNLGLQEIAAVVDKPHLIQVNLIFRHPREDGLSSREESEMLWEIEDRLVPLLKERCHALHAGCITTAGRREFYFYAAATGSSEEVIREVSEAHSTYFLSTSVRNDPAWILFQEALRPTEREMQTISDRWVLERLAKNGADPNLLHVLDHTVWFSTPEKRERFRSHLPSEYAVYEEDCDFESDDKPYWINVTRTQTLEAQGVHESVLELYDLAKQFDGYYDGWGTVAESGKQPEARMQ